MKFYTLCNSTFKLLLFVFAVALLGCKSLKKQLYKFEAKYIPVQASTTPDSIVLDLIAPYKEKIERDLDSVLSYAASTYSKKTGHLNTAIGNLMADIVLKQANAAFFKAHNRNVDVVILNFGGIRSEIPKGAVTARTAFQVMPFENKIVITALKGKAITKAINYLVTAKKAHPIAGLTIEVDTTYAIKQAKINGKAISLDKTYYVATSDYLYNGGDYMLFFKPNVAAYPLDYKIRNAMIDYFKITDTIAPTTDHRFIMR